MAQFRKDSKQYLPNGTTIFEVVMLADQYGNLVGPANPSGVSVDAFGRARTSTPLTLFDSQLRYQDSDNFSTANTSTGTYAYNANSSMFAMTVDTTSGAKVQRESTRVFAYQPGKSLQIFSTFVMDEAKDGLSQRVGYYNDQNGIFLEQTGSTVRFVKRSYVDGTVQDTYANQADWTQDTMLGDVDSSPSKFTLDMSKAQIFWTDIEWLGVGSIRCGFVINGQLIHCHTFNHANIIDSTYMTTACLPIRYEIENTTGTASNSTMQQICSSVISEGGYEIRGRQKTIGLDPNNTTQRTLANTNVYYPVMSIQLKSDRLDSIVVPKKIGAVGINQGIYRFKIVEGATINGAVWTSVDSDSSVEYNANNTATMTGGSVLESGYFSTTNQSTSTISIGDGLFRFQLERNGLTNTPKTFTVAVAPGTASSNVVGSISWDEFV